MFHREFGQNRSDGSAVVLTADYAVLEGRPLCRPMSLGRDSARPSNHGMMTRYNRCNCRPPVSEPSFVSFACLEAIAGSATQSQNVDREIRFIRVICG